METETKDDLPMRLADAIHSISALISRGGTCFDIASKTLQCATTLLPGVRAVVFEVRSEQDITRALAVANAPFINIGHDIQLSENSILKHALDEPFRVHHQRFSDTIPLSTWHAGFSSESDDVFSCKAVPRSNTTPVVLAIISDPDTATRADGVLSTLSELLVALCAGRDASSMLSQSLIDIAQAKDEWEKTADALPEVVCLVDQNGDVVRANRTVERWGLGDVRKVRGQQVHSLLHGNCDDPRCSLRDAVSLAMAAQSSNGYLESAITDKLLGRTLIVHTRLIDDSSIAPELPKLPSAVVVVSDITALSRAQHELARLNRGLEERVQVRTGELEFANRELAGEIERRRIAEANLQASRDELADLSRQLINAQEEERRRLSQELHDSLGQSLGAIKYSLERVILMIQKPEHGDPTTELDSVVSRIAHAITETRSLAISLRPPILDDIGTASAIAWHCQNVAETFSEIEFHIEIDASNSDIPDQLSTPLYRIVQEALNNVVKHAKAKTVMVSVLFKDELLRLEILDDGVGFDGEGASTGTYKQLGKIGRLGMRERAINSNGFLKVESWPGEGTRVTGEWKLNDIRPDTELGQ